MADTRAGQWEIGLTPTYAYLVQERQGRPKGGGLSLHLRYGLSRILAIKLSGLWTAHDVGDETNSARMHVINAALGLTYALDLVRFSPKVEAAAGVLYRLTADTSTADLSVKIGLGVDYLWRSWFTVGAAFHYHAVVTDLTDFPVFVEIGPRVALRWN